MHEVSFASLMHFSVGDRKVQGAGGGLEAFENRILLARRGWGRALPFPLFVVVADQSVKTREVLQLNNCTLENGTLWASAPLAFEEWVCNAPTYEAFRVVLTTCSGRYSEWAANGCCAYDRSVQVDNLTSPIMLQMAFNLPSTQTYILGPHMRCKHHQP